MEHKVSEQITIGNRLGSMLIDHFAMTIIITLVSAPFMAFQFMHDFSSSPSFPLFFSRPVDYIITFAFSLYYCKDVFNGRSMAKRALKLQVVDNQTGQVVSPIRSVVRNITCFLWPVEVVASMINTNRRIGDRIAGTRLVNFSPHLTQPKIDPGQIIIAVLVSYAVTLLLMFLLMKVLLRI